jgi:predicted amidohydrolase YtcJ
MKALILMGLALAACQTQKGPGADLILMNGHIVTMDEGSLEAGKLADMVVLSKDIMTIPAEEILSTEVLSTYLGGKLVFQRQ